MGGCAICGEEPEYVVQYSVVEQTLPRTEALCEVCVRLYLGAGAIRNLEVEPIND